MIELNNQFIVFVFDLATPNYIKYQQMYINSIEAKCNNTEYNIILDILDNNSDEEMKTILYKINKHTKELDNFVEEINEANTKKLPVKIIQLDEIEQLLSEVNDD